MTTERIDRLPIQVTREITRHGVGDIIEVEFTGRERIESLIATIGEIQHASHQSEGSTLLVTLAADLHRALARLDDEEVRMREWTISQARMADPLDAAAANGTHLIVMSAGANHLWDAKKLHAGSLNHEVVCGIRAGSTVLTLVTFEEFVEGPRVQYSTRAEPCQTCSQIIGRESIEDIELSSEAVHAAIVATVTANVETATNWQAMH